MSLINVRSDFLGAKLIALKKPVRGFCPIAVELIFCQLSSKCALYYVFESPPARHVGPQLGVGIVGALKLPQMVSVV